MKNLDKLPTELRSQIISAMESNDNNAMAEAMVSMANGIQENILKEANQMMSRSMTDYQTLNARGQAQLTSEERAYYKAVQEKRGFTNLEVTFPTTIFERVFEDLEQSHPLLSKITFENTTAVSKWILRREGSHIAKWGKLTSAITKELENEFDEIETTLCKLSAFLPVAKDMLDLGAVWLDRYVRTVLTEAIACALEEAIIKGTGNNEPIGMIKDLDGAVTGGVYSDKETSPLNDLTPKSLGEKVMSPLTNEGKRTVSNVLMIVNPIDYWAKIFPQTTVMNANGTYVTNVFPIPVDVVQSVSCPQGKMICGLAKDYFMGIGTSQNIEYSDEVRFLEDERVYIAKQTANGTPKNNTAFLVFDISQMGEEPVTKTARTTKVTNTTKADKEEVATTEDKK